MSIMNISSSCRRLVSAALCAAVSLTSISLGTLTADAAEKKIGKTIAVDDKYSGSISDLGNDITKLTFYVTSTKDCNFSYGGGVSTSVAPDYWQELPEGQVKLTAGKSTAITFDVSKIQLGYSGGKYEFRNYYSEGTLTLDKVVSNDTGSSQTTDPSGPSVSKNTKSGTWSVKDNGDGTATFSTTLSATLDDIDALLTAGTDEDDYLDANGKSTWEEGDPINSRKLLYSDFGIKPAKEGEKLTLESFTFAVESDTNLDTFMFGNGLNVEYMSPADSEYWLTVGENPDTKKGYWYNEHGLDEDGNLTYDESAVEIEIGQGTTLTDCGKWVECVWDVPADVQPYTTVKDGDAVSFQYWYGANTENGYSEVKEVTLKSATATFTYEKTMELDKIRTLMPNVKLTQGSDTTNTMSYQMAAPGDAVDDKVIAVKYKVSTASPIKKLVFGAGISDQNSADGYTGVQYAILNSDKTQEILWILPDTVDAGTLYGNLNFGYYYGADENDKLVKDLTVEEVELYLAPQPEVTTTTTTMTTTQTTTTTTETTTALIAKPGDVDENGKVDVADAVLLARVLGNDPTVAADITTQGMVNAECNGETGITDGDLTALLRYLAGLQPTIG